MEPTFGEKFFDINRFPQLEGILLFGISMNRIGNVQSASKCFEYMEYFIPKIIKPVVGLNVVYSDSLYLYTDASDLASKEKNEPLMHAHKYAFLNLLEKHPQYIHPSFSFSSWAQMLLETKEFFGLFGELKKVYKNDELFQKLVHKDIENKGEITENEENFILEEILMFYLASKGKVRFKNDFINDKQKWVLWCYPGKPLLSEIYLYKKNFFDFSNPQNIYENSFYDLTDKKLYDYTKISIEELENSL